ncbi:alpha-galactosidase [Coniochaeta sp. 2T2.1]|nr:alpha-galactosidase [Coniochaeta sp. 2T2.1]
MAPSTYGVRAAAWSALVSIVVAVNNGLARTPQLGWNNWNSLGCDVSEELLLETSQKLLDLGLRDVGYNYVVLDDCWSDGRDADGYLVADKIRFPRGMKFVADSIHEKGLLYGMYSSAGEYTCARYAGSLDHEKHDAQSFASWEVDYLKYDNCYSMGRHGTPKISYDRYDVMARALNATGRPMLYSLCNWGEDLTHTWGMSIANSWRMSGDIYDSFSRPDVLCSCDDPRDPHCIAPGSHCSVLNILNKVAPYTDRGQPGGWNDLDMLEVGLGGMTDDEYKAHFSMWALVKSPLLIGADIRRLPASALTILNNPAIIAINQDPAGRSAHRIDTNLDVKKDKYGIGEAHVWSGPLANGDQVVAFLNAADEELKMEASLAEIFVDDGPEGSAPQVKLNWEVYDLWAGRMSEKVAQKLIDASESGVGIEEAQKAVKWYNTTELSYADGLDAEDSRLFGVKIGEVKAQGTLKATVKRHSVEVFRLRSTEGEIKRYSVHREL